MTFSLPLARSLHLWSSPCLTSFLYPSLSFIIASLPHVVSGLPGFDLWSLTRLAGCLGVPGDIFGLFVLRHSPHFGFFFPPSSLFIPSFCQQPSSLRALTQDSIQISTASLFQLSLSFVPVLLFVFLPSHTTSSPRSLFLLVLVVFLMFFFLLYLFPPSFIHVCR